MRLPAIHPRAKLLRPRHATAPHIHAPSSSGRGAARLPRLGASCPELALPFVHSGWCSCRRLGACAASRSADRSRQGALRGRSCGTPVAADAPPTPGKLSCASRPRSRSADALQVAAEGVGDQLRESCACSRSPASSCARSPPGRTDAGGGGRGELLARLTFTQSSTEAVAATSPPRAPPARRARAPKILGGRVEILLLPTMTTPTTISNESTYQNDTLKVSIQERLDALPSDPVTIFRVPAHVREANTQLYEPRMVSIGPYYRGREELRAMEQHKLRYLRDFLERRMEETVTPAPLSSYVEAIRKDEQRARHSYYERTTLFDIKKEAPVQSGSSEIAKPSEETQDGFAEMLLLDGCFILEFMFKWIVDGADPLHNVGWGLALLNSDLLLLENQIPFFVLVSLYTVMSNGRANPVTPKKQLVYSLICLLQNDTSSQELPVPGTVFTVEIHHLLHLYHEAFMPKPGDNSLSEQAPQTPGATSVEAEHLSGSNYATVIPCTTQLREAGVRFKRKKSPKHMFDITFSSRGVMEIPRVEIDHANKPLLVNLIAFEQSMGKKGAAAPLTSYTALMTGLVRTGKDVEVLQKHGIIDNMLSSEDDTAKSYFNPLGDCCTLDYNDHYYATEFAQLNKHYKSKWNKYNAKFLRDHCANPCSIISFVVAVMAFSFAVSQASIAFYRFHNHH